MLTDTQADISYEKALDALDLLIDDDGIGAKERAAAERKRKRLTLIYIGKAIEDIEARTAKFQTFIAEMQDLIDKFDPATTLAGIAKLKSIVEEAGQLVGAATGAIAAMPKGRGLRGTGKAPARGRPARTKPATTATAPAAKRISVKRRPAASTRAGKTRPTRS